MRSELAIALVLASGCRLTDLDQRIAIVPQDLPDDFVANLDEAGQCWNLALGTQFVSGPEAANVPQQALAFFDDTTCLDAPAQVQGTWPVKLAICPQRYWAGLSGAYAGQITPFRVVSHELGHVANIIYHPDAAIAVMRGGGQDFSDMFAAVDRQFFVDANPNFVVPPSPCGRVIRSYRPGTGGAISHCACDNGFPFDLSRPIAVVAAPQLAPQFPALLAAAARCFNLRYGIQLVSAPDDADQHIYIERCNSSAGLRQAFDTDASLACILDDTSLYDGIDAIANAFGEAFPISTPVLPFSTRIDDHIPGATVACANIVVDATGECSCAP